MRRVRTILLSISGIGFAVFSAAFLISFVRPMLVESVAKEFIRRELEARMHERIASIDGTRLSRLAQRVIDRNSRKIDESNRKLSEVVSQKVGAVVAQMQDPDCECRMFVTHAARSLLTFEVLARTAAIEHLDRLIRTKYSDVVHALLREFRIFTAANAIVFLLLGATTFTKRSAGLQLLLPAVVLVGAATLVGSLYLFGQDWLHTVLFSDYVGLGYFAYLAVAIVFLLDVVFNHARVTTEIVNGAFNLVGAAIQAVPC